MVTPVAPPGLTNTNCILRPNCLEKQKKTPKERSLLDLGPE